MKILQINNIAGVSTTYHEEFIRRGWDSRILALKTDHTQRENGMLYLFHGMSPKGLSKTFSKGVHALKWLHEDWDLVIVHDTGIIRHLAGGLGTFSDIAYLQFRKQPMVVMFHGTAVRKFGTHLEPVLKHLWAFVTTPDLLKWLPWAEWLPAPVNLRDERFKQCPAAEEETIVYVNNPLKGSLVIKTVLATLQKQYQFKIEVIDNDPYSVVLEKLCRATIVIDWVWDPTQYYFGIYGRIATEAMAMGKMIVGTVDDRYDDKNYKGHPIWNADYHNLERVLSHILQYPKPNRATWEQKGREYVKRVHNVKKLVDRIKTIPGEMIFQRDYYARSN